MKKYLFLNPCWLLIIQTQLMAEVIEVNETCSFTDAIIAANEDQATGGCVAGNGSDVIDFINPDQLITVSEGTYASTAQADVLVAFPPITSEVIIEGNGLHIQADASVNKFRVLDKLGALGERMTLRNTTISGADDGIGSGSALFALGGRLTIQNVRFTNNRGALLIAESIAEVDQLLVDNNWNTEDSIFSAGVEVMFSGIVMTNSSIINNHIIFKGTDFEISNTHGAGGLGLRRVNPASIINTTISGNSAITGGGLVIRGDIDPPDEPNRGNFFIEITHSTITNNQALFTGGLMVHETIRSVSLSHNLIAGNMAEQDLGREISVADTVNFSMNDFNLVQAHEFSPKVMSTLGSDDLVSNQDMTEIILPLAAVNGLFVHAITAGSDAIDAGSLDCQQTRDQLGNQRPVDGDGDGLSQCDVGAVELLDLIFMSTFELSTE